MSLTPAGAVSIPGSTGIYMTPRVGSHPMSSGNDDGHGDYQANFPGKYLV